METTQTVQTRKPFRNRKTAQTDFLSIILYPYERYSTLPSAVDEICRQARQPFQLIVVEGDAPDSVRSALEERQRERKNMTILYTNFTPLVSEAVNLAMPHVRGHYVFVMDNDTVLSDGCLQRLLEQARLRGEGIVCPEITNEQEDLLSEPRGAAARGPRPSVRHFLASLDTMHRIGKFDENVCALLADLDLELMAKSNDIEVAAVPRAEARYRLAMPIRPMDLKLFEFQWDDARLETSRRYLQKKWPLALRGAHCRQLLEHRRQSLVRDRRTGAQAFGSMLQNKIRFARRTFLKMLEPLAKA